MRPASRKGKIFMKKLAVLVALCMALSLLPTAVFANEDAGDTDAAVIPSVGTDRAVAQVKDDEVILGAADSIDEGDGAPAPTATTRAEEKDPGFLIIYDEDEYGIATISAVKDSNGKITEGIADKTTADIEADGTPGNGKDNSTRVTTAPVFDQGPTKGDDATEGEPTSKQYEITNFEYTAGSESGAEKSIEKEGYYDVTLKVSGMEKHFNDNPADAEGHETPNIEASWVGLAFSNIGDGPEKTTIKCGWGSTYPSRINTVVVVDDAVENNVYGSKKGGTVYLRGDGFLAGDYGDPASTFLWIQVTIGEKTEYYKVTLDFNKNMKPVEEDTSSDSGTGTGTSSNNDVVLGVSGGSDDSASASSSSESTAPAAPALAPAAPEAPAETKMETKGDTTKTEVAAAATTDSTGAARAEVTTENVNKAIESAVTEAAKQGTKPVVEIAVETTTNTKSLNVELSAESLKTLAEAKDASLVINSGVAAVTEAAGADAVVVDLALMSNGVEIADYGEGSITISLPFTLPAGRTTANIVVYFLAADGTLVPCETTFVDGQVTFATAQLGEYVIGTK